MNLSHYLSGSVADALGWTLLHALWQGFAVVLPAAVVFHFLRHRSSSLRYKLGIMALLVQLSLSVATFWWYYQPVSIVTAVSATTAHPGVPAQWREVAQTLPWHQAIQHFLANHLSQLVLLYLIGVAVFGVRLLGGWVYLRQLRQTAVRPATAQLIALAERLRSTLAIQQIIQVRESARITVPMVVGVMKPVLLLPIGLTAGLTMQEVEAILAHELAHVKRHDYAVNLLQSVVEVLYFFHPALWWLSARVREEREHCCDDLAVQACGNGHVLAQALAHVEELRLGQAPALAMAFASKRQQLLHRVRRVLGVPTRPMVSNGSLAGLTLATLLLMSASVYAIQQDLKQDDKPQSTARHKTKGKTEFGIINSDGLEYVIWQGKRLSTDHVNRLRKQFSQVKSGKLQLNQVANQTDREILQNLLEVRTSPEKSTDGLDKALGQIDYNSIIVNSLEAANNAGTFPVNIENVLDDIEKIDYNSLINNALENVSLPSLSKLDSIPEQALRFHNQQMDSLTGLMHQQHAQMEVLQREMEKAQFQIDEVERKMQMLGRQKGKALEQRQQWIEKQQEAIEKEQEASATEVEKRFQELEQKIKDSEVNVEQYNKLIDEAQKQLRESQKPLEELRRQAAELDRLVNRYSFEYNRHNNYLNNDLNRDLNANLNRLELESVRKAQKARTIRPGRSAQTIRGAVPVMPPAPEPDPAAPSVPEVAPGPAPAINLKGARTVPGRAVAPKPSNKVNPAKKP